MALWLSIFWRLAIFLSCSYLITGQFSLLQNLQSAPLGNTLFSAPVQRSLIAPPPPSQSNSRSASNGNKSPSVLNLPLINLKRLANQPENYDVVTSTTTTIHEPECSETMFMSPFHNPVTISANSTIYNRIEKSCRWSFIGTEPCIPMISCSAPGPCDGEYLEIFDGYQGYMKVCAGEVKNIQSGSDLRDLFVNFTVLTPQKDAKDSLFTCTATCSNRGVGTPLPKAREPKVNPKCYCGTRANENRVVGGQDANKGEFPWLVALVETNTRQPFCGGSIINNKFILTAGHCIKGKFTDLTNIQVVVNGHFFDSSPNLNVMKDSPPPKKYSLDELQRLDASNKSTRYNIEEIMVHPLYVSETNDFDICLLKLQKTLDLSQKPQEASAPSPPRSICLPPLSAYLRTFSNKKATIAGWGLPAFEAEGTPLILQKLEVNVFSPAACKDMYAHRVNRRMLCAGHREGGKDACSGDSGGPLVLEDKPKVWVQIGAVSWGEGCAEAGNPGVYFRTTEASQWIYYHSSVHEATWCVMP